MLGVFLVCLFLFIAIGIPIAFSLFLTGACLIVYMGQANFVLLPQYTLMGVNNFALMAIPFFTLAGDIMNEGGLSLGIISFVRSILGHIKGGLGYVATVACMIFAGVSGAAVADTSAIGSVLLPIMEKEGYDKAESAAIVCSAGCTGPIIPPSIPMVVYAVIAGCSVTKMFLGGVFPGILTGILLMGAWFFYMKNKKLPVGKRSSVKVIIRETWKAAPSLMLPVIMLGGMLSGIFTPTEASSVAVVYALVVAFIINRGLKFAVLRKMFVNAALASSVIMLVVGAAQAISYLVTVGRVPQLLGAAITSISDNPLVILAVINGVVLLVGCVMDVSPAIMVLAPIFLPIATRQMGLDPAFFGVILVYGLCIGLITPPVGNVLYIGCSIAQISLIQLLKKIWPMVCVYILVLFIMSYFPTLVMWLPNKLMG
ncbi:MAG: TRAP transporter large permease [Spirochaetales bacterium]|jgi:tripartite ATP-independent transporter DctM subunit|nr:TRAP transporter large permease [Spirochaetales bacterium]